MQFLNCSRILGKTFSGNEALTAVWRQDISLVCGDGVTVTYPKLVAGLVFPDLATCSVLQVLIRAGNEPTRSFTIMEKAPSPCY